MSHNSLGTSYCRIPAKRTGISRKTSAFIAGRNEADREVPACFARGGTGRYGTLKVKQLQTLFSDNCLTQLIHDSTHCRGHILDWMVVRENNGSVSQRNVLSTSFSDHDAIVG